MGKIAAATLGSNLARLAAEVGNAADPPSALDSTTVPGILHDGSRIVHANQSLARWLACDRRTSLVGADLRVLASEHDHRSLMAALGANGPNLPRGAHVQRFLSFGGEPLVANVLSTEVEVAGQRAVLALFEPNSPTERSSKLLRLLEVAVDHLHDIVFITEAEAIDDVGRRIVFVNRIFTLVTGFELADVVGKTPNITIGELTDREVLTRIERALKQKRPVHEELLKYGKHGDQYWVELDILPVYDEAGQHTHWVSVQRDITERRLLEQKFVENERLASIGLLSAKLALEINSPLTGAQSSLDYLALELPRLLREGADPTEIGSVMQALKLAQANTRRVSESAGQLRLLAGSQSLKLGPLSVCEIMDRAVALLESTRDVPARIERHYVLAPLVLADASRLLHLFHFALENAAAALLEERRESNLITVRARLLADGVAVSIEDTGVGAPSEVAEQLFTPFGTRGRRPDQGLGLFVANCLARELGGRISVRACPHGGSLLEIVLPSLPLVPELGLEHLT